MSVIEHLCSPLGVLLGGLLFILYKWITRNDLFFTKRGIPHRRPTFLFGSLRKMVLMQSSFNDVALELYSQFPEEKLSGVYELMNPITMLRDPELIKQIGVKDFQHFVNHRTPIDEHADPLFSRNLFSMKGEKWRDMRSTLSPAFTGSKMRSMFELVVNCSEQMKEFLLQKSLQEEQVVEMKELFTKFANDVIATCAFGIQVNSLKDPKNEFFEMGTRVTNFGGLRSLKFFAFINLPRIMKALGVTLFSRDTHEFFRRVVMDTISYRETNNVHRPDMIQLLMQAKGDRLPQGTAAEKEDASDTFAVVQEVEVETKTTKAKRAWEDDDLTAQCLIFFFAGFDTASTLLSFIGHELAINPEIQAKLVDEVDMFRQQLDGKSMNYETINKMPYMDMVVTETLRKWPPAVILDRVCTQPYDMKVDGRTYKMDVGDMLWIPVLGIHRDPKYYPDPERFDPERFNETNKAQINPAAFLPFGLGPRNCIGSRFALMETKAILYSLLSAFTFEVCAKTQVPLRLLKGGFTIRGEKGFWVHLKRRPRSD